MEKELTEKQRLYLRLVFIEGKNHDAAAKSMGVPRSELSGMREELKEERARLQPIRDLWARKCRDVSYDEFETAYLNTKPHCQTAGSLLRRSSISGKRSLI